MTRTGMVLRARRGERAIGELARTDGPMTVGAWEGATLHLPDADAPVSAVFDDDGGSWRLLSLDPNGCLVNGKRVRRALLNPGDRVRIGEYELVVDGEAPPRLAPDRVPEASPTGPLRATLRWGDQILETRLVRPKELVTAGGRGATFDVPPELLGGDKLRDRFPVVAWVDGAWRVALDSPLRAVQPGGAPLLSAAVAGTPPKLPRGLVVPAQWVPLPASREVTFESGALSIDVAPCTPEELKKLARPPFWTTDDGVRSIIVALAVCTLLLMLRNPPPAPFRPDEKHFKVNEIAATFRMPPQPVETEERLRKWKKLAEEQEQSAEKAKMEEGKAGRPDSEQQHARRAGPKSDAEIVKEHELLKALSSGATQQLLSGGALAEASQLGNLDGPAIGDAKGTLGLGLRGNGPGGGGVGTQSVGVGPVGTKGLGKDAAGAGKIGGGGQSELGIDEPASVDGGLDREVIRRVILAHRAQIRFCYEKALQTQPSLAGKVSVEFVIGANGKVTTARTAEDSVGADVGSCIVSKVRTWTFPQPKGGGVVVVTYPFLFKPAGGGQ